MVLYCPADVALTLGILSTARINGKLMAGARGTDGVEIAAVASRSPAAAEAYAREHGIPRAHGSYEALLADPGIDAVYIPLPNALHVPWTINALRAGKHVLCEKPLSPHADAVTEAFAVAEQEGRILSEAFMYRHHPQTRRLAELVREGAIGRLRMISACFSFFTDDLTNVRMSTTLEGGGLMDVGCYCVNAVRLLAGEPTRVGAEQALGGDGVDVAFTGTMRFADEVLAHFDAGLALAPRYGLEVVGEAGALYLADPWHCARPGIELRRDGAIERIEIAPADPYQLELENFSAAVEGRAPLLLGRDDAVGQARSIEALLAAAQSGQTVTLG
jgi:D-xylose 1-dehydrogenase (NADP+, D-xylono-1,5-lactone-forming)